jgi:hypothetical protein
MLRQRHPDRESILTGGKSMTKNIKGLMQALQQSINEAILDSHDVAAAMAALKRTGKCPVFTIDIAMQDPPDADRDDEEEDSSLLTAEEPLTPAPQTCSKGTHSTPSRNTEELVLSDWDVEFLATLGVRDPSWSQDGSH